MHGKVRVERRGHAGGPSDETEKDKSAGDIVRRSTIKARDGVQVVREGSVGLTLLLALSPRGKTSNVRVLESWYMPLTLEPVMVMVMVLVLPDQGGQRARLTVQTTFRVSIPALKLQDVPVRFPRQTIAPVYEKKTAVSVRLSLPRKRPFDMGFLLIPTPRGACGWLIL